jgi:hypothetical protein
MSDRIPLSPTWTAPMQVHRLQAHLHALGVDAVFADLESPTTL